MMRAIYASAGLCLAATGCAEAPAAPATAPYDKPITFNAKKAFLEGYAADVAAIEVGEAPREVNALTSSAMQAHNDRMLAKRHGGLAVSAFRKLELGDCVWGPFDARKLPREARARIGAAPAGAYACSYKAHFQINPPHGEKFQTEGQGQFFERDGKLIYAGRYPNPYT